MTNMDIFQKSGLLLLTDTELDSILEMNLMKGHNVLHYCTCFSIQFKQQHRATPTSPSPLNSPSGLKKDNVVTFEILNNYYVLIN